MVIVADDGAVLPGAGGASLPEIRPIAGELDERRRTGAAAALAALAPSVRRHVVTIFSGTDGELVLEAGGGVTVTYGRGRRRRREGRVAAAVLAWAERRGDRADGDRRHRCPNAPTARTASGNVTPR